MQNDASFLSLTNPWWLCALVVLPGLGLVAWKTAVELPLRRLVLSTVIRSLIVCLLVLSLAGVVLVRSSHNTFVVFAVDESRSADSEAGRAFAATYVEQAVTGRSSDDFTVLRFAASPRPERETTEGTGSLETDWSADTNLQRVIEVSASLAPAGWQPHLVLISDGNETAGDAGQVAGQLNVAISSVPLPLNDAAEVLVAGFDSPPDIKTGEPFEATVLIESTQETSVRLAVFANEFRISSQLVNLQKGQNRIPFTDRIDKPTLYSASIEPNVANSNPAQSPPSVDTFPENNSVSTLLSPGGTPRILIVDRLPADSQSIVWALDEEGIQADVRPPEAIPSSSGGLQQYHAVVLSNVPATALSASQMEAIRGYVSDTGGGLVMLGGEDSFGLGGYYHTVVEEVLPVRCDFEKEQEKPSLAIVLVMDKSGSMGGQKIALAKEAAVGAVELLSPRDQIGVIAFDGAPYWISPVRPLTEKQQIIDQIATIRPDGGTSLFPALRQAYEALQSTAAKLKHVIVLTDGYSEPGDFDSLTAEMAAARITVTTVGIGDADRELLEGLAQTGRGRYYFTDDPDSIPQIFARETLAASQSAIQEEPFVPQLVRATSVLSGIDMDLAPLLMGYVRTRPRPDAETILVTESGDPLLAWWRHG
ncbi:MAG: VWA domain-containing protein, partial [Planctomycetaceae bacterium]|nr:VWA domain-containing protein [Planctomycetaceae bacterium]